MCISHLLCLFFSHNVVLFLSSFFYIFGIYKGLNFLLEVTCLNINFIMPFDSLAVSFDSYLLISIYYIGNNSAKDVLWAPYNWVFISEIIFFFNLSSKFSQIWCYAFPLSSPSLRNSWISDAQCSCFTIRCMLKDSAFWLECRVRFFFIVLGFTDRILISWNILILISCYFW